MKTFLSLASEASSDGRARIADEPPQSEEDEYSSQSLQVATTTRLLPSIPLPAHFDHDRSHYTSTGAPHTISSSTTSFIELSDFIERLNTEALYQSYLALSNQAIALDQLQRPFGFIFSIMDRESVTSYAKAELDATINQKPLEGWERVPLFSLGGAGTHYPGPSSRRTQSQGFPSHSYRRWGIVQDPLSLVAPDIKEDLEGDWFDLHDLQEFLRDKDLLLLLPTDELRQGSSTGTIINVARLILGISVPCYISRMSILTFIALISRGVCLGRSPGFQRGDVEKALQYSTIS
jgi:hypothetical protein